MTQYYNHLYKDIKDSLRDPSALINIPYFGPARDIHTVSVAEKAEIKIDIASDTAQQKRANTSLNTSQHTRK